MPWRFHSLDPVTLGLKKHAAERDGGGWATRLGRPGNLTTTLPRADSCSYTVRHIPSARLSNQTASILPRFAFCWKGASRAVSWRAACGALDINGIGRR